MTAILIIASHDGDINNFHHDVGKSYNVLRDLKGFPGLLEIIVSPVCDVISNNLGLCPSIPVSDWCCSKAAERTSTHKCKQTMRLGRPRLQIGTAPML